jgi:hypothetical protein
MRRRHALLALPLLAAGCAASDGPMFQQASLPRGFTDGAGDPLRAAILQANAAFSNPASLQGNPAAAARAIAEMEFLAVQLPGNPTIPGNTGLVQPMLFGARSEWRRALGISHEVAAQPVINALFAAAGALDAGQREAAAAALPRDVFGLGGAGTVERLGALPPLPQTAAAANAAQQALTAPQFMPGGPRGRFR